jgi:hypothetical protein
MILQVIAQFYIIYLTASNWWFWQPHHHQNLGIIHISLGLDKGVYKNNGFQLADIVNY